MDKPQQLCRQKSISLESIHSKKDAYQKLNRNMDALDLHFDNLVPTDTEATLKIQDLDRQLQQLKESMLQYRSVDSIDREEFTWETPNINTMQYPTQRLLLNSTGDEQDTYACKKELERARRENNRLVLEGAYLKNQNKIYEKRLREESLFRESLQNELHRLAKGFETSHKYMCLHQDKNNNPITRNEDNLKLLNEQLQLYKQDYYEERKEKERIRVRNIELETQLEAAKKSLEMQQKKLLLYSQIFSHPIRSELNLQTLKTVTPNLSCDSRSSSVPSTPSYYKKEQHSSSSLMSKHYKSNEHILEATILSTGEQPNVRRKTSSTNYTSPKQYEYEGFRWSEDEEDYISKSIQNKYLDKLRFQFL